MHLELWTQLIRYQFSNFFVTKNKVVKTDLQLVKGDLK